MPSLRTVPQVLVCTPEHFPARVDGLFDGGQQQILVQPSAAAGPRARDLLIHELAHALIHQQFGPQEFAAGHGPEWMRLMVRLGQVEDARWHATVYPQAMRGFQQALATAGGGGGFWDDGGSAPVIVPQQPVRTTMTSAEADLRGLQCSRVLLVPPAGGSHGYVLGAHFRSFTPLPLGTERIRAIRWVRPGVLELDSQPTPDGTPSLLCLG